MTTGDACPGILDLHEARDGLVARIRLPGGYATASRLRSLATLAERFGDGHVDLTARGNVQIRGIQPGAAAPMAGRAATAGFLPSPAHDRARNITASPLAGLAGHPGLRGPVASLDRAIRADPGLAALPGRFLFSLDDGTGRAGLGACDLGLRLERAGEEGIGEGRGGGRGAGGGGQAELIVAGRRTGLRGPAAQGIRLAIAAARAFIGHRPGSVRVARLADGGAAVAAAVGGVLGDLVTDTADRLALGPVPDSEPLAVVAAPLGRLTASQLRLIAGLLRPGEAARLTAAARIVLPLAESADAALQRLGRAGLLVNDGHELSAVTACAGLTCASSLADVRAVAARVPGLAAVHWAGCDRRCGLPADATPVVATSAGRFALGDGTTVVATAAGRFALGDGRPA